MEYENPLENLWDSLSHTPSEPLFEEAESQEPKETASPLEGRVEAMEYRLGRALLCLDRCRKDLSEIEKQCRELTREQDVCRTRQNRQWTAAKYGIYTAVGLIFWGQAENLASLGWQLVNSLAPLLRVKPELMSGALLAAALLWLTAKLGRTLVRKLLSRRLKGEDDHAVCDR